MWRHNKTGQIGTKKCPIGFCYVELINYLILFICSFFFCSFLLVSFTTINFFFLYTARHFIRYTVCFTVNVFSSRRKTILLFIELGIFTQFTLVSLWVDLNVSCADINLNFCTTFWWIKQNADAIVLIRHLNLPLSFFLTINYQTVHYTLIYLTLLLES